MVCHVVVVVGGSMRQRDVVGWFDVGGTRSDLASFLCSKKEVCLSSYSSDVALGS